MERNATFSTSKEWQRHLGYRKRNRPASSTTKEGVTREQPANTPIAERLRNGKRNKRAWRAKRNISAWERIADISAWDRIADISAWDRIVNINVWERMRISVLDKRGETTASRRKGEKGRS